MELKKVIEAVESVGNGRIASVSTKTEVKLLKRMCKAEGYNHRIFKTTTKNVRLGINYNNIEEVKAWKEANEVGEAKAKYDYVVENRVAYNKNQDKYYLVYFRLNNAPVQNVYEDETGRIVSKEEFERFMAKASGGVMPITQKVGIENVLRINKVEA